MPGELYTLSTQVGQIFHILGGSPKPSEAVHRAMSMIDTLKKESPIRADLERMEWNLNVPNDPGAISRARRISLNIEAKLLGRATLPGNSSLPENVKNRFEALQRNDPEEQLSREDTSRSHRWIRPAFRRPYMEVIGDRPVLGARDVEWGSLKKAPVFSAASGLTVYTKDERVQPVRSFKIRSGSNVSAHEKVIGRRRRPGGNSHGNAAQGVVRAAKNWRLDLEPVFLNLPLHVSPLKYAQCREMGAEVDEWGDVFEDGEERMRKWQQADPDHRLFVPAYNHLLVVAGQGSLGEEIREEMAALGHQEFFVVVPFGGGGLIAGIGIALSGSGGKVVGVSSEDVPFGYQSFKKGEIVRPERRHIETAAPGTQLLEIGEAGFPYILKHVHESVLIPEKTIRAGIAMYHDFGETIEGAGALPAAALLFGYLQSLNIPPNVPVVVVESGGNLDEELLTKSVMEFGAGKWMCLLPPEYRERLAKFLSN